MLGMTALLLLTGGFLTSCSREDINGGDDLPLGKYPLELTAVTDVPITTRSTVENNWVDVTSVAMQVNGTVKQYNSVSSDGGATARLTSADPFVWQSSKEQKEITAWVPYSDTYPSNWTVKADQSTAANYIKSDFIKGDLTLAFADRDDSEKNKITFQHQTVKMVIKLVAGANVSLDDVQSVQLVNVKGVEGGANTVTPYRPNASTHSYYALITAQDLEAGKEFIQITTDNGIFYYTPSENKTLGAGTSYTYTLTVKADRIELLAVNGCNEWVPDLGFETDITSGPGNRLTFAKNELKIGDYFYADGTYSDGGLREIDNDAGTRSYTGERPELVAGKTLIGIVFHVGLHDYDDSEYYTYSETPSPIDSYQKQAYVVALKDANSTDIEWGIRGTLGCFLKDNSGNGISGSFEYDWNGYVYTQKMVKAAEDADEELRTSYPAAYYASTSPNIYTGATTNSSGWFLPTVAQLLEITKNSNIIWDMNNKFETLSKEYFYLSSNEYNSIGGIMCYALYYSAPNWLSTPLTKDATTDEVTKKRRVRPILLFHEQYNANK